MKFMFKDDDQIILNQQFFCCLSEQKWLIFIKMIQSDW